MRPSFPVITLLVAALHAGNASALSSDSKQPIEIQADRVVLDERKKVSIYEGNVEMVQGSLHVTADRVEVQRGAEVERIIATGKPVTFRQKPDGDLKEVRGEAGRVEYRAQKPSLELSENAQLWQGEDKFSGPRIVYEADRNVVQAGPSTTDGEKGRITVTIQPRKSESTGEKK